MTVQDYTSDMPSAIEVSKAIHQTLGQDPELLAILGDPARLYDHAPKDPVFPYLSYGPIRSEDISADGAVISRHVFSLHIWSRYSGRAEILDLSFRVGRLLTRENLSLPNSQLVSAQLQYSDIFRASDGRTLHGLLRYAFTTDRNLDPL